MARAELYSGFIFDRIISIIYLRAEIRLTAAGNCGRKNKMKTFKIKKMAADVA